MKPTAIVYTSNTGNTARYAAMLAEKLRLPIYSVDEAKRTLPRHTPIIYLGWLIAGKIKDFGKAKGRYRIVAVGAVGLGATGTLSEGLRKSNRIGEDVALFELQGGMDHSKLTGIYKKMIETLVKMLSKKKDRTAEKGGDFVAEKNLDGLVAWFEALE